MQGFRKPPIPYPEGKDFVFSIFDDTDVSTLEYIRPIYDKLADLGIYTTKSVWPLGYSGESDYRGSHTLQNSDYAAYVQDLQDLGFEIAYHGPTMVSSTRETAIEAFKVFHDVVGRYPRMYASHSTNRDNLYWGSARFTMPLFRRLYALLTGENNDYYQGHKEGSPYFWGDLCIKHIDYVRNFTFDEVNLLRISDQLVYRDQSKPWVRSWFHSSDADNVEEFNRLLCEENQEKLQRERGICLVSTHFGKGFVQDGKLHKKTEYLLGLMSERNGWFVPVSRVLDFMSENIAINNLSSWKSVILETKWFLSTIRRRGKSLDYDKTEIAYLEGVNSQ